MEKQQQTSAASVQETPHKAAFGEFSRGKMHPTTIWDLFKMYLYRLYHTKSVYIVYGVLALVAIIAVSVFAEINAQATKSNGGTPTAVLSLSELALWCFAVPGAFSNFMQTNASTSLVNGATTSLANFLPLGFIGLMVICFFVGKDWQNRTFRNQILAGHGRIQIYLVAQLTALLIALGLIITWEATIWSLGSALRVPAFVTNQFETTIGDVTYDPNPAGVFCASFFMELLIYISLAVISCAWSFIIPNSWGSFGLLYGTLELFALISVITYALGYFNADSYYQLREFFLSYQMGQFSGFTGDYYATFSSQTTNYGTAYVSSTWHAGRTLALCLKTAGSSLVLIGGMGYLGGLAFVKRDLK